ncbi:MAG: sensor histidine kinase [Anaerolineae bacterium]|jgi:two-component sensor histidine kinase
MHNALDLSHCELAEEDVALLEHIVGDMPILADLGRSDLLLFCRDRRGRVRVVAQAMPHSVTPLYEGRRVGTVVSAGDYEHVVEAFDKAPRPTRVHTVEVRGSSVARSVHAVLGHGDQIVAVLAQDSYWLAYERHRRRTPAFRRALQMFFAMVLRGDLEGGDELSRFGEHDGILYVGLDRRVRYVSGVAAGIYRRLGYRDDLMGRRLGELETPDQDLMTEVLESERCVERSDEGYGRVMVRKALPVMAADDGRWSLWARRRTVPRMRGVLLLVHDATEAVETRRELESKLSLIREVHHRVKNNLQVIASLMRMQARRSESAEVRTALGESVNRILSVAVVHEFLSRNATGNINLQDVAHRILNQTQQGLIDPSKRVELSVEGADIWLPAERATQCALVMNELVQNAVEHGIAARTSGRVWVRLDDHGDAVSISVMDDGQGLPSGFTLDANANLGLSIVWSMVERDLRGSFALEQDEHTRAVVRFSKTVVGGG